ncbi:MAG TPA: glycoside hydrolase family 52 protein, partial [Phycisphaerae bacterium]|nr:glycoside hydrolase family 52 protein [Phycisphaerae bacterium]
MPAPLLSVDHAPVGAWTSLKFGAPNRGLSLRIEGLEGEVNADLLVAVRRGDATEALPLVRERAAYSRWRFAEAMERTLTPCIDEFRAAGIGLKVFTPHAAVPNPKRSGNLQYATAPGVLVEITIDNTSSGQPATGFIGIAGGCEALRPLDWSSKTLCGVGHGNRWLLAAQPAKDEVYTVQDNALETFAARIDPRSVAGGIAFNVAPGTARTLTAAFAAYLPGSGAQGIEGRYYYTQYFQRAEAVANFLLQNAQRIRESCTSFDARAATAAGTPEKAAVLGLGLRAANARTQVLDAATAAGPGAWFAAIGGDGRRNPLDTIADRLPWDLFRNPWVVRNLFDLATASFAYHDKLRFPGEEDELRDGGPTFNRDFGFGTAYAPRSAPPGMAGSSAFDGAGTSPGWSGGGYGTEVLLNAIYMLTSYALLADDTPWAKTRLPFARELLASLEKRDHWDPERRTGILKGESASAPAGEKTRFTGEAVLAGARGSLYIAVKTFCANLLLTTYFQNNNDLHSADYSYAFAQKTAKAIVAAFDAGAGALSANLLAPDGAGARVLAAFEPLAVPTYLGLTSTLPEYFPELYGALKAHAGACLQPAPAGCLDGNLLRLSSNGT